MLCDSIAQIILLNCQTGDTQGSLCTGNDLKVMTPPGFMTVEFILKSIVKCLTFKTIQVQTTVQCRAEQIWIDVDSFSFRFRLYLLQIAYLRQLWVFKNSYQFHFSAPVLQAFNVAHTVILSFFLKGAEQQWIPQTNRNNVFKLLLCSKAPTTQ